MKIYNNLLSIFFMVILTTISSRTAITQETVMFDETVTWNWPINNSYGGNSFYWWHYKSKGVINLGDMPSDNWISPANYWTGNVYLRFEVLSQPTSTPFQIQMGIWQDGGTLESVSNNKARVDGGNGTFVEVDLGSPTSWYKVYPTLDFTRPGNFDRIGVVLWTDSYGSRGCIPMAQGWGNTAACSDAETRKNLFFPMQARITVIACASGTTFSGWGNYTDDGSSRHPRPSYTIDYTNERTAQVIPPTDEYAYSSSMSGAVSGSGAALTITPGQNVYFRTKASEELEASLVQTLVVPSRPPAPSFGYDAVQQRTSTTVSNEYEYSDNSDMSDAVSGNGNYVNIATGTTKYFRKKATSGAFKSNIQTLTGTGGGGSGTPSNIGPEFIILNEIVEFSGATDADNGFYFFFHNSSMPVNWFSNFNYKDGQIYTRYEIISQATNTNVGLQFGIWQTTPTLYETMEPVRLLTGPGSVAVNNSSPSSWWKLGGINIDWTRMDLVWHFGINPYKEISPGTYRQIRTENPDIWNERYTHWLPMTVRVTVVAVASGHTFSGWENYLDDGTAPDYQIDFINEQTKENVVSTDEYSFDQSTWTTGSDTKINLTPGQTVYIRKIAAPAFLQTLNIPERPAAPAFTIDYINERTAENISSAYEHSDNSDMSGATTGTSQVVALTPESAKYFRALATETTFSSSVQTLDIPARPAGPSFTINYLAERTSENIPADVEYSDAPDFASSIAGTGTTISLTPGTILYFRKPASASQFVSTVSSLNVPERPAAPSFGINYPNERTSTAIGSDYEYSLNVDMSPAVTGTNASLSLMPGTDVYFRKKATSSDFQSAVQHMVVSVRPAAPAFTIDYAQEQTTEKVTSIVHYTKNPGFSTTHEGTGVPVSLVPGTDMYFRFKATSEAFKSHTQTLEVPERPKVTTQATSPASQTPLLFVIQFPSEVTGFESDDIQVTNGVVSNLSGSYTASVMPSANGLVTVLVKAAKAEPANFASLPVSVTYSGITAIEEIDQNFIVLYPNPTKSAITIKGEGLTGSLYRIVNIGGTVVFSGIIEESEQEINVNSLSPGIYHLVIMINGKNKALRFVRQDK